jgi:hypothetical protein
MSKKIEITFGVGKTKDGKNISNAKLDKAIRSIKLHAATFFGGYTLLSAEGGWKDSNGNLVEEPSKVLVLHTEKVRKGLVTVLVDEIKDSLNQEIVVVSTTNCNTKFV